MALSVPPFCAWACRSARAGGFDRGYLGNGSCPRWWHCRPVDPLRYTRRHAGFGRRRSSAAVGWWEAAGRSVPPDVAAVIALPPLIFLGFLAAATVLEAILPLPILVADSLARYVSGAMLAAGGIAIGTRLFAAAGTNVPPTLPTTALVGRRHLSAKPEPALPGIDPCLSGPGRRGGKPVGDPAACAAAMGDQRRRC
jgi:hypothetical protein